VLPGGVRRLAVTGLVLGTLLLGALIVLWLALCDPPRLLVSPRRDFAMVGVTVVNPGQMRLSAQTVTVHDARIGAIHPTRSDERPSTGAEQFMGAFVLPGLVDVHIHLPPHWAAGQLERFMLLFLAHGVTTIREVGSLDGSSLRVREAVRSGALAGPRVFACGPVLDGDPPSFPRARVVHTAEEGRRVVDELATTGVDCIKVYRNLSQAALAGVSEEAQRQHLPVIGHLPASAPWHETRIQEIQHVCDPRCWQMGEHEIEELVRAAVAGPVAHTPTLVVYEGQGGFFDYDERREQPVARLLPRFWRDVLWNPAFALGFSPAPAAALGSYHGAQLQMVERIHEAVRRLHAAGARIQVGTDPPNPFVVPGASVHREMRLLEKIGFTPEETWIAATRNAGLALGVAQLGVLAPGAPADLLVFREDPTRDLRALESLEAVFADGRFYPVEELKAALAAQDHYFERWLYDRITVWVATRLARAAGRWAPSD